MSARATSPSGLARLRANLPALVFGFGVGFSFASGVDRDFNGVFWLGVGLVVVGLAWMSARSLARARTHT